MVPALATRTSAVSLPVARPTTQWLRGFRALLSLPTPRSRTSQCNGKDMNENIQEKESTRDVTLHAVHE